MRKASMQTQSAKQEALQVIQQLPDNIHLDEIIYRLYVLDAIHKGVKEIDDGKAGISVAELQREIKQW